MDPTPPHTPPHKTPTPHEVYVKQITPHKSLVLTPLSEKNFGNMFISYDTDGNLIYNQIYNLQNKKDRKYGKTNDNRGLYPLPPFVQSFAEKDIPNKDKPVGGSNSSRNIPIGAEPLAILPRPQKMSSTPVRKPPALSTTPWQPTLLGQQQLSTSKDRVSKVLIEKTFNPPITEAKELFPVDEQAAAQGNPYLTTSLGPPRRVLVKNRTLRSKDDTDVPARSRSSLVGQYTDGSGANKMYMPPFKPSSKPLKPWKGGRRKSKRKTLKKKIA